jgi:hypothetical protein
MAAGRRLRRGEEWAQERLPRRAVDETEAIVAASQALLDAWPWLTEQYRRGLVPELPMGPVGAAVRRYLEIAGD